MLELGEVHDFAVVGDAQLGHDDGDFPWIWALRCNAVNCVLLKYWLSPSKTYTRMRVELDGLFRLDAHANGLLDCVHIVESLVQIEIVKTEERIKSEESNLKNSYNPIPVPLEIQIFGTCFAH